MLGLSWRKSKKDLALHQVHDCSANGGLIYTDTCWSVGVYGAQLYGLTQSNPGLEVWNPRPFDCESNALTACATGAHKNKKEMFSIYTIYTALKCSLSLPEMVKRKI